VAGYVRIRGEPGPFNSARSRFFPHYGSVFMDDEHRAAHAWLEEHQEQWLLLRRGWRVALRVHLEREHGAEIGREDPEVLHWQLHDG
jgi:hypothetical protein